MMDWDDLRVFLAVARGGTLSSAAEALRTTQPTVGRRITAFERSLGAALFVRARAGLVLTDTGAKLVPLAEQMEASALEAERAARGRDEGLRGRVWVTASDWLVERVLSRMVADLAASHEGLELSLVADARPFDLGRRDAEIALRPFRTEQPGLVHVDVGKVAFGAYASARYLAARGVPDFELGGRGHTLLVMDAEVEPAHEAAWLGALAPEARVAARANGRMALAGLAEADAGIAFLPCFIGDASPKLRAIETPSVLPDRRLWLVVHEDTRAVPRVKQTLAFLKASMRSLEPALQARRDPRRRRPSA